VAYRSLGFARVAGFLIVNPRSGDDSPDADELVRAAESRGIRCHLMREDDDPAELARTADADALGVAGGDGSLAAVADTALARKLPFVCVPFGTRNHFARDVGLDRDDPIGALDAFGSANERRVDVGRVNGRAFLNNVSLGVYASLVHRRERHRRRDEALARARALVRVARERHRLHVRVDGQPLVARVLLVANNAYTLDLFTLGERETLDGGELHLYAAAGWLPHRWTEQRGRQLVVEVGRGHVRAAADGEPLTLEPPLRFELEPRALRVLLPPRPE
jgi:diacylglycerol kinase family enzyme